MTDARRRSPGWWWPWFVVALLVATAGGQGVILYAATHDPTFAVEPDYYKKAVDFDSTIQLQRGNLTLGWTATARGTASPDTIVVQLTLADRVGAPVAGAHVAGVAIHNLDGGTHVPATFTDLGGGAYEARLATPRRGLWELRLDATRAGERFTPTLRMDVRP
jgi:nitrogen fixation protein FixH